MLERVLAKLKYPHYYLTRIQLLLGDCNAQQLSQSCCCCCRCLSIGRSSSCKWFLNLDIFLSLCWPAAGHELSFDVFQLIAKWLWNNHFRFLFKLSHANRRGSLSLETFAQLVLKLGDTLKNCIALAEQSSCALNTVLHTRAVKFYEVDRARRSPSDMDRFLFLYSFFAGKELSLSLTSTSLHGINMRLF